MSGKILVTGAAGYLGAQLVPVLAKSGRPVLALDRLECRFELPGVDAVRCDMRDEEALAQVFAEHSVDQVVHLATELNIAVNSQEELFRNNVAMTRSLLRATERRPLRGLVFTSSFAVYSGLPGSAPIGEDVRPVSIDEYGKSKIACEELLEAARRNFPVAILRCPLVIGGGRVGMLSILFDLIAQGSPLFTLKRGAIRHHCVSSEDTLAAIRLCLDRPNNLTVNLGTAEVRTFRELFQDLIAHAGSRTRMVDLGSWWSIPLLRLLFRCGLSPLGPHQFRMLTEDCVLDVSRAEKKLGWKAGTGHLQMMREAYDDYLRPAAGASAVSPNSRPVKARLLRLLRFIR